MDIVSKITEFEGGQLTGNEALELFSELLKTGTIYSLQGYYQRTMNDLIRNGFIDKKGNILRNFE